MKVPSSIARTLMLGLAALSLGDERGAEAAAVLRPMTRSTRQDARAGYM